MCKDPAGLPPLPRAPEKLAQPLEISWRRPGLLCQQILFLWRTVKKKNKTLSLNCPPPPSEANESERAGERGLQPSSADNDQQRGVRQKQEAPVRAQLVAIAERQKGVEKESWQQEGERSQTVTNSHQSTPPLPSGGR